jgi:RNA polymerase sigma-70 factor (ECF subfamily)
MAFPTTRWSLLVRATIHGDAAQAEALGEFYRRYREPVLAYLRNRHPSANAEDLAQEFFLHLMENSTLQRADPLRGRFRSFLLGALNRFLSRDRTQRQAVKRGGGETPLSLDGLPPGAGEPAVPPEVSRAFDQEWAKDLLLRVRRELAARWKAPPAESIMLLRYLPGAVHTPAYEVAATELGWTLARLKTEVFRQRQTFREMVRAEVALTVDSPEEIEAELKHLRLVLSEQED